MKTRKLVILSLLTTIALTIFVIESQIPPLVPIPGVKLGLSNVITLLVFVWFGKKEAFAVLILRILIANMFTGHMVSFMYSLAGGVLSYLVICITMPVIKKVWVVSVFAAIFHNLGQIIAAVLIMGTWQIFGYFFILLVSGIVTGAFTGLVAEHIIKHIKVLKLDEK